MHADAELDIQKFLKVQQQKQDEFWQDMAKENVGDKEEQKRKRKRPKAPNPLSVKKPKKIKMDVPVSSKENGSQHSETALQGSIGDEGGKKKRLRRKRAKKKSSLPQESIEKASQSVS